MWRENFYRSKRRERRNEAAICDASGARLCVQHQPQQLRIHGNVRVFPTLPARSTRCGWVFAHSRAPAVFLRPLRYLLFKLMSAPAPSIFTPAAKAMAEKLGLKMGRANLEEFAAVLEELAKANPNIVAVTSDSRGSGKLAPFGKALPKQIVEVGIAEQNLVGITAGLAACGKRSFGVSPACFLTARSLEQIKNDVCYSDVPAVLVGISAGVSYGALGSTHHSLHDLAALRAIRNLVIIVPADNFETREAIRAAAKTTKPTFVRFGK